MLSILRNCQFSKVAAIFYIPTSNGWGFQLVHILTNICYYLWFCL
jgi:hypothetical protein